MPPELEEAAWIDGWLRDLPDRGYLLATVHRAANTDDPARLAEVFGWAFAFWGGALQDPNRLGPNGGKYGLDHNRDGRIDEWFVISPEEASQELLQAVLTRDPGRRGSVPAWHASSSSSPPNARRT